MGFKNVVFVLLSLLAVGCATPSLEQKKVYAQGYQRGVKEQMQTIASQFQGGNFPFYHWSAPIVQEVDIPAHISNGVFLPAHKELVIIKPGEWAQSPAYPIQVQEEPYEQTKRNMDIGVADITYLPNGKGPSGPIEPGGKDAEHTSGVGATK